ncbi:MAG: hypothetical protein JO040_10350 [Gemmatimonadetes bacterium]|nr:hypothetical protein [Gemmatimonadota bacterium]
MTMKRGLVVMVLGLGAASVACARPKPEADATVAREAALPADTVPAARALPADTQRMRVPGPRDTRPWIPARADSLVRPSARAVPAAPAVAQEPAGRWTAGVTSKPGGAPPVAVLRAVRSARGAEWDRVVFEFAGRAVPGYHVEYARAPAQCGSGDVVQVAGQGRLEVRFLGTQAHTDEGKSTVAPRERKPALPVLREMEMTCDFEGDVTWVLGVARPNRYRVMELSGPARLVVDVRH